MTVTHATPAAAARRARSAAAPAAAPIRPPGRAGGDRDRHLRSAGSTPRCCACCSPRRPPAVTRPPPGCAARSSGLPAGKTFDAWEPVASAIPTQTQQALRTLEWIDRHETLVICGPSGTGKSHFIEALGHLAIDNGKTVAWHTPRDARALVHRHRADDSVNKAISKLIRCDLILIDDVGLLPVSSRRGRGAVPRRRRRLRETIDRDQLQHPPVRVRRADAQDARDRDRRPAAAPRPRPDHRRPGQLPARSSDRRQGGQTPLHLTALTQVPDGGEIRGHQRGENMAASGEN